MMNIIIWNCRGALKPSFLSNVRDLVSNYDPAILVVMETHLGGDRAKEVTDKLPFQGAIHTDTTGFTGGLWLLWDTDRVEISNLASTEQEVHAFVKVRSSNLNWIFTTMYASSRFKERCLLWNNLVTVANNHNLPWVIAGDFNEMLSNDEKFGGRPIIPSRAMLFKECLDMCNMADLGFQGPRFTWTNKQHFTTFIQERLDRYFANPNWCVMYPEAQVTHLPRCSLDHCPVLLELQPHSNIKLRRPFRFQRFWLSDDSISNVVHSAWSDHSDLNESILRFTREITTWNKTHFGNIFATKRRISARLNGIQKAMADRPSSFLINLEKKLQIDLSLILNQEKEL